ncbi:glutathionylspermidine synthase family protein [Rhodanobacter sp. DHG33]|uniref:glutathionylspermidine synthase family protein n=1 Tax=Rhodanobacter sp. DHG33 TaxID=2775921 RepID=UPI00178613F3|nr:glutathionylspermidine synthase family protein [Rhodanobacter sp. DHG33]MBD8898476.1 glutathionylspermidine synthase family protein [Rhodanobacter sp. DHG33]
MHRMAIAPRTDWQQTAEAYGFRFHTISGEMYWDESAYYAFSLQEVERNIEDPTGEIHQMAMSLVGDVLRSEALLTKLAIPSSHWDWIADSWRRGQPHLYGRMDLAYDGTGPAKLYELNYDTPTSLYEAAFFQWIWLEQQIERGALPKGADQYNSIQDKVVLAFAELAKGLPRPFYFSAARGSVEDQGTVDYLRDCAQQAGLAAGSIAIEDIGLSTTGTFTDLNDIVIGTLFKLYPLEDLFADRYGSALPGSGLQLIEPPWKSVLSNKGILPLLWERYEGHPNLLPAYFEAENPAPLPEGWVRKPLFSREGANIRIRTTEGDILESDGPYVGASHIRQAYHPLTKFPGGYPLIGSWIVGDAPAGMGLREDAGLITRDTSRFVPHVILD